MTSASPDGADREALPWAGVLDRMEQELRDALVAAEPVLWRPPAGIGPIPPDLRERASRLLEAQRHTIRHLEDVRRTTARHLAAVRSVPRSDGGVRPVYFDLMG